MWNVERIENVKKVRLGAKKRSFDCVVLSFAFVPSLVC
jgi:hypothetical protein